MSERIRWGVLGCASIAEKVFNGAVQESQTGKLYAIASRNLERARGWRQRFGFQKVYADYTDLLHDAQVDAVYVPLPNALHAEWAIAAARAGKHVYCEKPAAMNAVEGERMVAAAREAGALFVENFAFRFHPQSLRLRQLLDDGAVGDVLGVQVSLQFRMQDRSGNVRLVPQLGGGAAYDLGCYMIAFSRFVFNREPVSVLAYADPHPEFQVDTTFSGVLDFGEGRTSIFHTSFDIPGGQQARILGTHGEIVLPAPLHPRRPEDVILIKRDRPGIRQTEEVISTPVIEPFTAVIDNMGECIRQGGVPILPAEDAIDQARVLDAALRSAREGRRVWLE